MKTGKYRLDKRNYRLEERVGFEVERKKEERRVWNEKCMGGRSICGKTRTQRKFGSRKNQDKPKGEGILAEGKQTNLCKPNPKTIVTNKNNNKVQGNRKGEIP